MKLLLPLVASLMLQYQVTSEFLTVRRCLMGFGKCKSSCLVGEVELHTCKSKKCCIGPKVTELIKSYLRHEIPHIPDNDTVEMLKSEKNPRGGMQRKRPFAMISQILYANPLLNSNSAIIPNASPVKSVTKQMRDAGNATPQSPPGPSLVWPAPHGSRETDEQGSESFS